MIKYVQILLRAIVSPLFIGALVVSVLHLFFTLGEISGRKSAEAEFQEQMAIASAKQGAKDYEKLTKAIDANESTRAYLDSVRTESNRMRKLLARREAELAKLNAGAGVAGCESLLRDGVELLGSCRERLIECAGKHDALVELIK